MGAIPWLAEQGISVDLEALSAECARAGRYEFMFVLAPLNIPGGAGSPVSPIAVL